LFAFNQLVDAWRRFAISASKVKMLRCNRNRKKILLEQSPIRKLESCESRFLWKNWSYSHTTWKHLCEPIVVRVRQGGKPWSKRTILHRLPSPRDPCCIPNPWDG